MEIFTVISNLALLIPAFTAVRWRRVFRASVFFLETFVSAAYHLGDYTGYFLFSFKTLHFLDYWFAQMIMILNLLYLFDFGSTTDVVMGGGFPRNYYWLEWIIIILAGIVLVILQIALPGDLYVQAIVATSIFAAIVIYWLIYACIPRAQYTITGDLVWKPRHALPPYDWSALSLAVALLGGSTILYSASILWPDGFWLTHSLWHVTAAVGSTYMFMIKRPAPKYANAAGRITI